ncbi:MAG: hypothetical protein JRF40_08090 [Deltaproteobacteria bacterium]|nr:hypothetical protein [Deltaproteobacteria bacterium]MBW2219434.1 hypothetical protein [Deltaproteobacteria bacterium]
MTEAKNKFHIVWGFALVSAGLGVIYRIPQVIQRIKEIGSFSSELFFIKFCFYLMAVMLIGGGSKKIYDHYRKLTDKIETK